MRNSATSGRLLPIPILAVALLAAGGAARAEPGPTEPRTAPGGTDPAAAAVAIDLAGTEAPGGGTETPAAADPAAPRREWPLLQVGLGASVPLGSWMPERTPPGPYPDLSPAYGSLQATAVVPSFGVAHLMAVNASGSCRLGPELGFGFLLADPDDPPDPDPYYDDGTSVSTRRFRLSAGLRIHFDLGWGYIPLRVGLGPILAAVKTGSYDVDEDLGLAAELGTGVGFHLADWFALTLSATLLAAFHEADDGGYENDVFFTQQSLDLDVSLSATFLI